MIIYISITISYNISIWNSSLLRREVESLVFLQNKISFISSYLFLSIRNTIGKKGIRIGNDS